MDAPRYTMFLGISAEPSGTRWEAFALFAYRLIHPDGREEERVRHYSEPVKVTYGEDPHYEAILDCSALLPDGAHLEVVSGQQHYHGKTTGSGQYVGPVNEAPAGRRARGYLTVKGDPIANAESLRKMDEALEPRGITLSGRHASALPDKAKVRLLHGLAAKEMHRAQMVREGLTPEPPEWEGL